MRTLQEVIADAKAKALNTGKNVMIYDQGDEFITIEDGQKPAEGHLSYIVGPDGSVNMVDG